MMYASDFRKQAREKLGGQWGGGKWATFALIALIYSAIVGVCSALSYFYVGSIALLIITGPLTLGLALVALNVMRGRDIKVDVLFGGFKKDFSRSFALYLLNGIFVFLWSLLLVIPGIIMSFAYSMSFYILADHPSMSANEARKKSIEIMRGNKWRLFCLQLSFLGWILLSAMTFGILMFWVMPYMETAQAAFYEEVAKNAGLAPDNDSPAAPNFVTSGYGPRSSAAPAAARYACPNCGAMNGAEAKFCITCGHKLESAVCNNCGALNGADTKYCSKCGHKLGGVKCPSCGAMNDEGTNFCSKCGAKYDGSTTCPSCGTPNTKDAKFCSGCGKSLAETHAAPDDAPSKAPEKADIVCPECGTHNDDDTKFCINCGKKLK